MNKVLSLFDDITKNAKQNILKKSIKRFDIVSREEFEIEKKILLKTRQKLEQIEVKLDKLLADR